MIVDKKNFWNNVKDCSDDGNNEKWIVRTDSRIVHNAYLDCIGKNPWHGFNSHTESDRLYGRDMETEEFADIVLNNILTVLYGRSGVGKSSLLRAGIFRRLQYEDYLPVYIRLRLDTEEPFFFQIRRALKEVAVRSKIDISFAYESENLCELLHSVVLKEQNTGFILLPVLIFDQFEELFTLMNKNDIIRIDDFFSELAVLLNGYDRGDFRIIISVRDDCLHYIEEKSAAIPCLKRNHYALKPLTREQGLEVITGPSLVSEDLAGMILDKIDLTGNDTFIPVVLSLFMYVLYDKGKGSIDYENISLVGNNIISDFYEEGLESVSPETVSFLEEHLVNADGCRLKSSFEEALKSGVTKADLESLRDKHLINIENGEAGRQFIELSHDTLCAAVLKNKDERKFREEVANLKAKAAIMKKRYDIAVAVAMIVFAILVLYVFRG